MHSSTAHLCPKIPTEFTHRFTSPPSILASRGPNYPSSMTLFTA